MQESLLLFNVNTDLYQRYSRFRFTLRHACRVFCAFHMVRSNDLVGG